MTVQLVNVETIQHRAEEHGPRIGKIETYLTTMDNGSKIKSTATYWYQWETGNLLFVK
jgi:hypothetical protein